MGLGRLEIVYYLQRGDFFIHQNLTSTDVRIWRIKTVPALKGLIKKIFTWIVSSLSTVFAWVMVTTKKATANTQADEARRHILIVLWISVDCKFVYSVSSFIKSDLKSQSVVLNRNILHRYVTIYFIQAVCTLIVYFYRSYERIWVVSLK